MTAPERRYGLVFYKFMELALPWIWIFSRKIYYTRPQKLFTMGTPWMQGTSMKWGALRGLLNWNINKPTGAGSRDLTGGGLMLGVSLAEGTGWRWLWRMLHCMRTINQFFLSIATMTNLVSRRGMELLINPICFAVFAYYAIPNN